MAFGNNSYDSIENLKHLSLPNAPSWLDKGVFGWVVSYEKKLLWAVSYGKTVFEL